MHYDKLAWQANHAVKLHTHSLAPMTLIASSWLWTQPIPQKSTRALGKMKGRKRDTVGLSQELSNYRSSKSWMLTVPIMSLIVKNVGNLPLASSGQPKCQDLFISFLLLFFLIKFQMQSETNLYAWILMVLKFWEILSINQPETISIAWCIALICGHYT